MTNPFNEQNSSQIPAMSLLMKCGYKILTPQEVSTERKGSSNNAILENILRSQLDKINRIDYRDKKYHFSEANIQDAITKIKNIHFDGLIRTNKNIYELLKLGTSFKQNIEGNNTSPSFKYIDWKNVENNVFHFIPEFEVLRENGKDNIRIDIVLFVNGLPLCSIECKKSGITVQQAIEQTIRNQKEDYCSRFFTYSQLLIVANKHEVKYATTKTDKRFWANWKEKNLDENGITKLVNQQLTKEQKDRLFTGDFAKSRSDFEQLPKTDKKPTEQDKILHSLCNPERLLDLIHNFILFDTGVKKITRYQQYFSVKKIMNRIKTFDDEGNRKGGVIWHTQGSGKSLMMVMIAKAIKLDPEIKNQKIIVVTDRIDLDDQIKDTFGHCDVVVEKATSGINLINKIKENKVDVITTIIHKFTSALKNNENFNDKSRNVFILVDEGHRSQNNTFHVNMRKMFPNACYLGFTGTPLMKKERSTFAKFGGIIDKYTVNQAIKDKAVVPLLYEGRYIEKDVNKKAIDIWFDRTCKGLTREQKKDLKKKYAKAKEINEAEQTIYCTAFDISEHYNKNWKGTGFKGQIVTSSKATALLYKKYLDEIGDVNSEVIISAPDMREGDESVDESYDKNTKQKTKIFWKNILKKFGTEKEYNKQIIESFKNKEEPELLIVVDKLLTGFDAPCNTILYLTRALKDHTLLQAIARVNRLYSWQEGTEVGEKEFGYIIDYANVLGNLNKALSDYSSLEDFKEEDLRGILKNIDDIIKELPKAHRELLDIFKTIKNKKNIDEYELLLTNERIRKEFYATLSHFIKKLSVAMSSYDFIQKTPDKKINEYKKDLVWFVNLRTSVRIINAETIDFSDYEAKIKKLLNTHIITGEVDIIVEQLNIFDEDALDKATKGKSKRSKADTILNATKKEITEKMDEDPAFYKKFSDMIEEILYQLKNQCLSDVEYLSRIKDIKDKVVNYQDSELPLEIRDDNVARPFYGIAKIITDKYLDEQNSVDTSVEFAKNIAGLFTNSNIAIVGWENNTDIQNKMKNQIEDVIIELSDKYKFGISYDEIDGVIDRVLKSAKERKLG